MDDINIPFSKATSFRLPFVLSALALFISFSIGVILVFYLMPNNADIEPNVSNQENKDYATNEQIDDLKRRLSIIESTITTRNEVVGEYALQEQDTVTLQLQSSGSFILEKELPSAPGGRFVEWLARGTWSYYAHDRFPSVVFYPECAANDESDLCKLTDVVFTMKRDDNNVILTQVGNTSQDKNISQENSNLVFIRPFDP